MQIIIRVLCVFFTIHSGCFWEIYNMDCSLTADVLGKHADGFRITGLFSHLSLISVIAIEVDMPWKSIPDYGTNMEPWDEQELRNCLDPVFKNLKVATIV